MATTSFLYHALGLHGYRLMSTEYREGKVVYHVEVAEKRRRCRDCEARWWNLTLDGCFERTFLGLPVGSRRQEVVLHGHLQSCKHCGQRLREPIDFAPGMSRYLKAFGRYVVDLCGIATIKGVAKLLGVGWDLVKGIYKEHLRRRHRKRSLRSVRYLAVDEFATHKGHQYMTVAVDLETGEILHAHEGKDAAALVPFLEQVKRARAGLRAVAIDMSGAYLSAVRQVFGDSVEVVHDPYHVVALANRAIDETRRDMLRELAGPQLQAIKGTRFLLLKGLENLKPGALGRLMRLMEVNQPLYEAYLLKEDLRMFWNLPNAKIGRDFLDRWIAQARATGNKHFIRFAQTLDTHRSGLLSYFNHRISTAPLEGLNNKIKVLKRQAYGFRDMEYFKLRLYFLHESRLQVAG
jgi:transposase